MIKREVLFGLLNDFAERRDALLALVFDMGLMFAAIGTPEEIEVYYELNKYGFYR